MKWTTEFRNLNSCMTFFMKYLSKHSKKLSVDTKQIPRFATHDENGISATLQSRQELYHSLGVQWVVMLVKHKASVPTLRQILLHMVSFELRCWLLLDQLQKPKSWVSTLLSDYSIHAWHALVMEFVIRKQHRNHATLKCSIVFREIHLLFAKNKLPFLSFL